MVVALTGGIGSGKTIASGMFEALGVPVIDADEISRDVTRAGGAAFARVVDLFGPAVLGPDGELRRDVIRRAVFEDGALRGRLEAIVHPLVYSAIHARIACLETPYCVVPVPLLIESGAAADFDRVLVVDAPEELRVKRIAARDGLPEAEIRRIMGSQVTRDARLRAAHDVIRNDGTLDRLRSQIERLHRTYTGLAKDRVAGST